MKVVLCIDLATDPLVTGATIFDVGFLIWHRAHRHGSQKNGIVRIARFGAHSKSCPVRVPLLYQLLLDAGQTWVRLRRFGELFHCACGHVVVD